MFGKRRNKSETPTQGATLTSGKGSSIDPSMLILVHSRGQGSTPGHKALMARALANPPMRGNSVLANGLANRGLITNTSAQINEAPTAITEPVKGDIAWDSTGLR
ncbi:MAG: hypothetical protein IVW57_03575 [Ktedonobacterales bacterium]|nr:hypothetical protein [Ktedonobacterales bacterium]